MLAVRAAGSKSPIPEDAVMHWEHLPKVDIAAIDMQGFPVYFQCKPSTSGITPEEILGLEELTRKSAACTFIAWWDQGPHWKHLHASHRCGVKTVCIDER